MADKSKLQQQTSDFVASWDERKRTFEALRNQRLNDEDLTAAIAAYKQADREFTKQKNDLLK